ncbi:hypothetical protein [Mycolicibacterium nivoides]|uniref:hypothetical protein n=1 Tax=Mycolicibacterium nivoides TaxID=2487344 RepID=UPI000F5C18AA|nr:hypothetical protein [Mycolicibacterium nivoides]
MLRYITRTVTRTETRLNPQLDGLTGTEYRRMCRYLSSIGELLVTREIVEELPPKYAFDERGELVWVNLTGDDIRAEINTLTPRS